MFHKQNEQTFRSAADSYSATKRTTRLTPQMVSAFVTASHNLFRSVDTSLCRPLLWPLELPPVLVVPFVPPSCIGTTATSVQSPTVTVAIPGDVVSAPVLAAVPPVGSVSATGYKISSVR